MLFIERLYGVSLVNNFKFNMKKLRTNFALNVSKISHAIEKAKADARAAALAAKGEADTKISQITVFDKKTLDATQLLDQEMFNWIGIGIHMKTLGLVPNINLSKEAVLCTLNTNMQTKDSVLWLKRKLKSFLMNNVSFYFRSTITTKFFAMQTLDKLYDSATEKYVVCCKDFKKFHMSQCGGKTAINNPFLAQIDLVMAQVIYVVIRSFFKYLVCNIRGGPGIF